MEIFYPTHNTIDLSLAGQIEQGRKLLNPAVDLFLNPLLAGHFVKRFFITTQQPFHQQPSIMVQSILNKPDARKTLKKVPLFGHV